MVLVQYKNHFVSTPIRGQKLKFVVTAPSFGAHHLRGTRASGQMPGPQNFGVPKQENNPCKKHICALRGDTSLHPAEDPSAIIKLPIDIKEGLSAAQATQMATEMGFTGAQAEDCAKSIAGLYKVADICVWQFLLCCCQ